MPQERPLMAAMPWTIVGRIVRVASLPGGAEAERQARPEDDSLALADAAKESEGVVAVDGAAEHAAAADAEAQALVLEERLAPAAGIVAVDVAAEHAAAAAAAEPDFIFRVAPLPRAAVLAAGCGAHPEAESPDLFPYVVSAAPSILLVHFTGPIFFGTMFSNHLVVVRDFRTADGGSTASAERVPGRPSSLPVVVDLESLIVVPSDGGGAGYTIAELQVGRACDLATIIYLRSGPGEAEGWRVRRVTYPLAAANRRWRPHGAVHVEGRLWWFDLTWGILSCGASLEDAAPLVFHELPAGRGFGEGDEPPPHIHTKRWVAASWGKLRYVEIIIPAGGGAAMVSMWSRSRNPGGDGWRWDAEYAVSFKKIWDDDSYKKTGLPRSVPVLAVVSPSDPRLVYFALEQRIFCVNVQARRVVRNETYELADVPGPARPASGRYVVAWQIPLPLAGAQGMPEASSSGSSMLVRDVWAETSDAAFEEINALLRRGAGGEYKLGLDSEFAIPDGVVSSGKEPPTEELHYTELCKKVNGGDIVQIGITVADASFKVQGVWQFNIRFDASSRKPWHAGVAFLRDQCKLKLKDHASHGIPITKFMHWLVGSGLLGNRNVTWISYAGGADFGFLIRLLTGEDTLPKLRGNFLMLFSEFFPRSYDVRVFTKLGRCRKEVIHGGLSQVCEALQVERVGKAHQAGSDALSAVRCLERMTVCDKHFAERSEQYCGVLYGLVENE